MEKREKTMNYKTALPLPEKGLQFLAEGVALAAGLDMLLFMEVPAFLLLLPVGALWCVFRIREWRENQIRQMRSDFRTALNAMSISLKSGSSVERAIPETAAALTRQIGVKRPMTQEFVRMADMLRLGIPAVQLFRDYGRRAGFEEAETFADVFEAGKTIGGNLARIVRQSADQISEMIETEEVVDTALAGKKMEAKMMAVVPAAIIGYLRLASPGYLAGLYHTLSGQLIMSGFLVAWIALAVWGIRIVKEKG